MRGEKDDEINRIPKGPLVVLLVESLRYEGACQSSFSGPQSVRGIIESERSQQEQRRRLLLSLSPLPSRWFCRSGLYQGPAGSSDKFDRCSGKASQRSQLIGDITGSNRPSQTLPQFGVSRKTGKARWVSRLIEGPGATRLVVKTRERDRRLELSAREQAGRSRGEKDTGNAERRRLGLKWPARSNAELSVESAQREVGTVQRHVWGHSRQSARLSGAAAQSQKRAKAGQAGGE